MVESEIGNREMKDRPLQMTTLMKEFLGVVESFQKRTREVDLQPPLPQTSHSIVRLRMVDTLRNVAAAVAAATRQKDQMSFAKWKRREEFQPMARRSSEKMKMKRQRRQERKTQRVEEPMPRIHFQTSKSPTLWRLVATVAAAAAAAAAVVVAVAVEMRWVACVNKDWTCVDEKVHIHKERWREKEHSFDQEEVDEVHCFPYSSFPCLSFPFPFPLDSSALDSLSLDSLSLD